MSTLIETVTAVLSEAPSYKVINNTKYKASNSKELFKILAKEFGYDFGPILRDEELMDTLFADFEEGISFSVAPYDTTESRSLRRAGFKEAAYPNFKDDIGQPAAFFVKK